MSRQRISWSGLPPELLSEIAGRLQCRSDIFNFRSVCRSWRNSAPLSLHAGKTTILSPILPHKFSIDLHDDIEKTDDSLIAERPLVLVANSVFLIRSIVNPTFTPWLFSVEEFDPGKLYLRNFLSTTVWDILPSNFPKHLSLPCFRVSQLSRHYALRFAVDKRAERDIRMMKNRTTEKFRKVIIYADKDKCEPESTTTDTLFRISDCVLMVVFDDTADLLPRNPKGTLAKITLKDRKLFHIYCGNVKNFDDVVCFKGRVCVIDRRGRLYLEKNNKLEKYNKSSTKVCVGDGQRGDRRKCLVVEPCGELYLVYRCPSDMGVKFKVYKLNEEKKEGEECKGIGDNRIIVATGDGCFFVSTKDIPTWGGNCLVFTQGVFTAYNRAHDDDWKIFEISQKPPYFVAIYHFGSGKCEPISHGYGEVLWPFPAWLSSDAHSSKW